MKSNYKMLAEASSSMQVSADSYKTAEEYSTSDIPNLSGYTYPRPTCTFNNPEVLKVMFPEMPVVEFLAEVLEPNYPSPPPKKPGKSTTVFLARMK
ncbi:hypothetical protein Moror_16701, partial [Moniliophthora roreri MCA 2997]